MSKSKASFKRGEWVTPGPGLICFERYFLQIEDEYNEEDFVHYRRASARELRAESKRLADRAAMLAKAADAVEAKKGTRTCRGKRNARK